MRNCLRRSKLELRRPRNDLITDPRSSGGVHSASCSVQHAESADEAGRRARRRGFSDGSGRAELAPEDSRL
eukprot:15092560-Alexandrium_andersonii.AAC.1